MDYLIDTNVLLRALANPNPHKLAARNAIKTLLQRGADLCVAPQNLIEFWGVCTRPAQHNGLGKSIAITDRYWPLCGIIPDGAAGRAGNIHGLALASGALRHIGETSA